MRKYLALAALALSFVFAPSARAQSCINSTKMLIVNGSLTQDSSGALLTGALDITPTDNSGNPLGFMNGAGGQTVPRVVSTTVTAGVFTINLADTACTAPPNICYSVAVFDNSSGTTYNLSGFSCWQPTATANTTPGRTINFDNVAPNTAALLVATGGPIGGTSLTISGAASVGSLTSSGGVSGTVLTSTVATGTAPLTVASTTVVPNLNASFLSGLASTAFAQLASTANAFAGTVQGTRLISTIATGTAPLTVASTTLVSNLNAQYLNGIASSGFAQLATTNTFSAATTFGADALLQANYLNFGSGNAYLSTDSTYGLALSGAKAGASNSEFYRGLAVYAHNYGSNNQLLLVGCSPVSGVICGIDTEQAGTDTAPDVLLGYNAPKTVIGNGGAYNWIFDTNAVATCVSGVSCQIGLEPMGGAPLFVPGGGTSGINEANASGNPVGYFSQLYAGAAGIGTAGTMTAYNNLATAGVGMASIMSSYSWLSKTAAIASTNLQCGGALCGQGMYRVTLYAGNSAACSGATVNYHVTWNDGTAQSVAFATQSGAGTTQSTFVFGSSGTANPTFSTTVSGISGSCSYYGDVVVEQIETATGNATL